MAGDRPVNVRPREISHHLWFSRELVEEPLALATMMKCYAEHAEDADKARIAPLHVMAPTGRAAVFCSLPLGMHQAPNGALFRNNKENPPRFVRYLRVFRVTPFVIVACGPQQSLRQTRPAPFRRLRVSVDEDPRL